MRELFDWGAEKAEQVQKWMRRIRFIRTLAPLAPIILKVLAALAIVIVVVVAVMGIIRLWEEFKEAILDGTDRFANLITFQGWTDSETAFKERLESEYKAYESYPKTDGEFDMALLATTIHYGKLFPPESYQDASKDAQAGKKTEEYKNNPNEVVVSGKSIRSFYVKANAELGGVVVAPVSNTGGLIDNLVGFRIVNQCVPLKQQQSKPKEIGKDAYGQPIYERDNDGNIVYEEVIDFDFGSFASAVGTSVSNFIETSWKTFKSTVTTVTRETIRNYFAGGYVASAYKEQGVDYVEFQLKNSGYNIVNNNFLSELGSLLSNSSISPCGEWSVPVPEIEVFMDYDKYKKYLREVYVKTQFLTCDTCTYKKASAETLKLKTEEIIEEIFAQKQTYDYLFKDVRSQVGKYTLGGHKIVGPEGFAMLFPKGTPVIITSKFGLRDVTVGSKNHKGMDFGGINGVTVHSPAAGVVVTAVYNGCRGTKAQGGYDQGCHVVLSHDLNNDGTIDYYTKYFHFQVGSGSLKAGDIVARGTTLGKVGTTGVSSGPHLHFEIHEGNSSSPVNPANYINYFNPQKIDSILNKGKFIGNASMTGYGPDCDSCNGLGVTNCPIPGSTNHNLVTQGALYEGYRIIATAHDVLPCGSVVKIRNHPVFGEFTAIVLDTGGAMKTAWNNTGEVRLDLAFITENPLHKDYTKQIMQSTYNKGAVAQLYDDYASASASPGLILEIERFGW